MDRENVKYEEHRATYEKAKEKQKPRSSPTRKDPRSKLIKSPAPKRRKKKTRAFERKIPRREFFQHQDPRYFGDSPKPIFKSFGSQALGTKIRVLIKSKRQ